jgi:hypothetical protein
MVRLTVLAQSKGEFLSRRKAAHGDRYEETVGV